MRKLLVLVASMLVSACTSLPEGIDPVKNFESDRYLGTWYEIARLDHSFERNMNKVTAANIQERLRLLSTHKAFIGTKPPPGF